MKKIKITVVALIATVGLVSMFSFTGKSLFTTSRYCFDEANATTALISSLQPGELSDPTL